MTAIILAALVVAGLILNGLRLRARVPAAIPPVPGSAEPPGWDGGGTDQGGGRDHDHDWAWLAARSTAPAGPARSAAVAYALAEGLDLLEVVPADLPATAARDLVRRVDPRAYRADRFAVGRGAGAAMLADRAVAERAEIGAADLAGVLEPADVIAVIARLRPYVRNRGAAIAVAPWLRSGDDDLAKRAARLRANGEIVPYLIFAGTALRAGALGRVADVRAAVGGAFARGGHLPPRFLTFAPAAGPARSASA